MLIIAWLVALLLAAWLFGNWEDGRRNPNQAPQSRHGEGFIEVQLASGKGGHYLLDGQINGSGVTFLLDTGATQVAIPLEVAETLGLQKGAPIRVHTANGSATGWRTSIQSLQLGDIRLQQVAAIIVPKMPGGQVLLGMSALKQLEFTQRDGSLVLRQNAALPEEVE
ncbi:retropepsin-like aspartic protease family protein [Pseudomonas sp. N040]|uniref:retropepsin-like aspartic protease family protein n=1 Tax=Pseudomonas sp. N040 TaxID=2785325 RepID=UPI0018A2B6BF|nr:TIGR02281 family clan AA aspartic protease [Pseudomonas sp. N040]MBW7013845.1 TIGR02281 family clan AA aspartic protease [Pseudomonas sp. N040]